MKFSSVFLRFAGIPKRHIIPQIIPSNTNNNNNLSDLKIIDTEKINDLRLATIEKTNTDTLTASLAASLAVSVTQPFLKIQNDLENKVSDMLKQFETLKKSESLELNNKHQIDDQINQMADMKLKYIEKLQENQVIIKNENE